MSVNVEFSRQVFRYRDASGLTQEQMAELCGISIKYYQRLEMGQVNPGLSIVVHIAKVLNIDLDALKSKDTFVDQTCRRVRERDR
ncbi:helix-turn-helix domain-containing protein [Neobittarella massiliensis]|uniref:Helix-turn-helix transcriptional regulator n=1 Tax=Neobittarella massiliensis (ex Bilen et al. 2018) TaxID=2041842 RepID=A0A8J6IMU3_9FIRM|nr:helix-turn-helix transcriptional regulator [Neobittarella massiliensis]MBC3515407.1 helix-turn-helix transcriptional regulator [Neobittarella massiliensis]